MPSLNLAKVGLTVSSAVLPSAWDIPLALHQCNPALCDWEWTEGEALVRLVLLPEIWTSTVDEPDAPSARGKVWIQINEKWREGEIIAKGKGMSKWVVQ